MIAKIYRGIVVEFRIIYVADDDIDVGVLCMVKIVEFAHLNDFVFILKPICVARLRIYDFRIGKYFPENLAAAFVLWLVETS